MAVFLGALGSAQEVKLVQEEPSIQNLIALLNIRVISASKTVQPLSSAPAKVAVITAEDIRKRGYMGLDEVFRDLAGVDISQGRAVEWTTLFPRGMRTDNTDRFLLIWDGVIQNDPWKSNVWISRQYPLMNIRRIEVVYGPGSLLYGANAFGGIVNIILKKPGELDGWSVQAAGGSYNTRLVELNGGKDWGAWRFMANARVFRSDEMDVNGEYWVDNGGRRRYYNFVLERDGLRDPSDPSGYAAGLKVSNGVARWSVDGRDRPFDGRAFGQTRDWFVQVGAGYEGWDLKAFYWSRQESQDLWYLPLRTLQTPWTPTGSAISLSHTKDFSPGLKMHSYLRTLSAGLDPERSFAGNFTRTINNDPADPANLKVSNLGKVQYYNLFNREWRVGQQFNLSDLRWEAVLGWEYVQALTREDYGKRDLTSMPWSSSSRHDERNAALFASVQVTPDPVFSFSGGFRCDYNYLAGEAGGFGTNYTARLAAILSPTDLHRFKILYGQAFQAPSPWQKFSTVRGDREMRNPYLKPERLNGLELIYELSPFPWWKNSLSVYYNQVIDLISAVTVLSGSSSTHQNQNGGSLRILGQELESRYLFSDRASLFVNLTFNRTKAVETGKSLADIAPFKANAGLDLSLGMPWSLNLRGHYVSSRDTASADSENLYAAKRADSYLTFDLSLAWMNALPGLEARLGIYNLLNRRYFHPGLRTADGATYNSLIIQPGIRIYLGATYRF